MARTGRGRRKKLTTVLLSQLWRDGGKYPAWGTSPEWDEVLSAKRLLDDCMRYHCLPSQLDGEDYHVMQRLRMIADAEEQYRARDAKSKRKR